MKIFPTLAICFVCTSLLLSTAKASEQAQVFEALIDLFEVEQGFGGRGGSGVNSNSRFYLGDDKYCITDKHCPADKPYCVLSGRSRVCRENPYVDISNVTIFYDGQNFGSPWLINTEFTELTFRFENSYNCTDNPLDTNETQVGFVKFTVTPHHHTVKMDWDLDGLVEIVDDFFDLAGAWVAPAGEIDFFRPSILGASVRQVPDTCVAGLPRIFEFPQYFISELEKGVSYDILFAVTTRDRLFNSDKMFYTLFIDFEKA